MNRLIFIAILFLTACSDRKKNIQPITNAESIQQLQPQHIATKSADDQVAYIKSDFFEIAHIDYQKNWLQRIFVVISPDNANDTSIIRQIIWALKASYPLDNKSNISFFSEKKYANYKTTLFLEDKNLLPQTEYKNWVDDYYLGEYSFETNEYKTFPVSSKRNRQKIYMVTHPFTKSYPSAPLPHSGAMEDRVFSDFSENSQ